MQMTIGHQKVCKMDIFVVYLLRSFSFFSEGWKAMAICFTALGSVTFIPGFYVTRIA
jgi:hypothetical protein